jgi:hypothetical protein
MTRRALRWLTADVAVPRDVVIVLAGSALSSAIRWFVG